MAKKNATWRMETIGTTMFAAADLFVRDTLRTLHENELGMITDVQLALFQNLDLDGTRLTKIAQRARMTKQGMLQLVNKAQSQGLVERQRDDEDLRAKKVVFTSSGLQMLGLMRVGVVEAERRLAHSTGRAFISEMKKQLSNYIARRTETEIATADLKMSNSNPAWRLQNIGHLLFLATDIFIRDILHVLHENGFRMVTEVQLTLFRNLDLEGSRLTEIAERARMTKQATQELVDKAEALQLVERQPHPQDGRAKIIVFSPSGFLMREHLRQGIIQAERRFIAGTESTFVTRMKAQLTTYASGAGARGARTSAT